MQWDNLKRKGQSWGKPPERNIWGRWGSSSLEKTWLCGWLLVAILCSQSWHHSQAVLPLSCSTIRGAKHITNHHWYIVKNFYLDWGSLIKQGASELYSPRQKPSYPYPAPDNPALCSPSVCTGSHWSGVWIHRGFVQLERCLCLYLAINFAVICLQRDGSAACAAREGSAVSTAEDVSGIYTARLSHMDWIWYARCFCSDSRFLSSNSCYTKIGEGLTQALFSPPSFPPCQTHTLSAKSLNHALFPELQDCELHIGPL